MLTVHNELADRKSDCSLGLLIMENVNNIDFNGLLVPKKNALEHSLREKYGQAERSELKALRPISIYGSYFKKFGYTYHVLLQLEDSPIMAPQPLPQRPNPALNAGFSKIRNHPADYSNLNDGVSPPLLKWRVTN